MAASKLPEQKTNPFEQPRMLTPSELESLKQDMQAASDWLKQQPLPKNKKRFSLPD